MAKAILPTSRSPYSVKLVLREIASAASESRAADKKIFEAEGGG